MTAYYNEFDPYAAQFLRNLIKKGQITPGFVDSRSILEVKPEDLKGFTQCHFFAGIGVWSLALRNAGWSDETPVWTGSCPCQPFSSVGNQLGKEDERHLAPTWLNLIDKCKPDTIFGEQVEGAIKKHWLDDLFDELERKNYACGSAVLPACSVGAPHKRDRLFFGSKRIYNTENVRQQRVIASHDKIGWEEPNVRSLGLHNGAGVISSQHSNYKPWGNPDWVLFKDGNWRPIEPGTQPLVNGSTSRVGRLRAYGNAIVPQAATEFIIAFEQFFK